MSKTAYRHQMPATDPIFGSSMRELLSTIRGAEKKRRVASVYKDKKKACEAHSGKRLSARFGFSPTRLGRTEIQRQILSGSALHLWKQSCSRHHYAVNLCDQVIPIVWDRFRNVMITVLPPDALAPYADRIEQTFGKTPA